MRLLALVLLSACTCALADETHPTEINPNHAHTLAQIPCAELLAESPVRNHTGAPPRYVPDEYLARFTLDMHIPVTDYYVDDSEQGNGTHYVFSRANIDHMILHAREKFEHLPKIASKAHTRTAMDSWILHALRDFPVKDLHVVVYGSMEPWWEAVLLAAGAKHVTTIEYNRLTYDHPDITTLTLEEFAAHPQIFDAALSISSFDHDGLGRYGDPLNPESDLRAMQRTKCSLKPNATLILTVPIGPDALVWNLHRRYGPIRLPLLLNGWEVMKKYGWRRTKLTEVVPPYQSYEPVFVLKNV